MHTQLNWMDAQPAAAKAMMALEGAVLKGAIEKPLAELVRMRVSQMNGCAFCMDMHSHDMIKAGENPQRIFVLSGLSIPTVDGQVHCWRIRCSTSCNICSWLNTCDCICLREDRI